MKKIGAVAELKNTAGEFSRVVSVIASDFPSTPKRQSERARLLATAERIRSCASTVLQFVDKTYGAIGAPLGIGAKEVATVPVSFLRVVPEYASYSAIAAMTLWLFSARRYLREINQ